MKRNIQCVPLPSRGWKGRWGVLCILFLILVTGTAAHVPLNPREHDHLDEAQVVENPTKSWVVYDVLEERGDAHYYLLPMSAGDRISLTLMVPEQRLSLPSLAVFRPYDGDSSGLPSFIEIPGSYGAVAVTRISMIHPVYEPFTPAALYTVARYQLEVTNPGTYYAVVYTTGEREPYSLAIGYKEEFSPLEWVLVPLNVISIHIWEGQSPLLILAPAVAVLLSGGAILLRNMPKKDRYTWMMSGAGLMYCAGSAITLVQMGLALAVTGWSAAVALTIIFIMLPVIVGGGAIRWGFKVRTGITYRDRILMAGCGLIGLVIWAGLLVGPAIALLAAVLPDHTGRL